MKNSILLILALTFGLVFADTPPPNTVKAKLWSGDGLTQINANGNAIETFFTNSSLAVTGTFWQTTQPVSGTFWQATQPVSLLSLPSLAVGANTIGNVNINGTVPISGTITATNSANGNTGSAVPTQATQVGGVNGGNLVAIKADSDGSVVVDASGHTVPVSGTVTANIGSTNGLALDSSVNGLLLGQASTTSGQDGPLIQGAVTTAAPTYSSTHTSPLSLTTVGNLRVDGSTVTQPISAVSLPLPALAATSTLQSTINTTLGTPFQAGGSIGNTSFAATQGTAANLNVTAVTTGGATIAKDSSLSTINTTLGTPFQASGSIGNTSFAVSTPTALTVHQAAVSIGTSAVRLTYNGSSPASTRVLLTAQLLATSTSSCYMGSSTVTTSGATQGVQMFAGQTFSWNHDAGDYWAICGNASQTFLVMEQE